MGASRANEPCDLGHLELSPHRKMEVVTALFCRDAAKMSRLTVGMGTVRCPGHAMCPIAVPVVTRFPLVCENVFRDKIASAWGQE